MKVSLVLEDVSIQLTSGHIIELTTAEFSHNVRSRELITLHFKGVFFILPLSALRKRTDL